MRLDQECVGCIINQSMKVAKAIKADKVLTNKLRSKVEKMSEDFSFSQTPPEVASHVYEEMAILANKTDLYDEIKAVSTKTAQSLLPELQERVKNSDQKLLTATKIAIAGNVIDLAAAVEFDLHEELENIFHRDFDYNDFDKLSNALATAKNVVIIGDNVGEHIFDHLFIETLQELYPQTHFSYMVRGNPIINDVTMKEAVEAGFDTLCNLVDSGVNTPGFTYERANETAKELFDTADLVISKGMGNYECMSPVHRQNICFLLKVKCDVVAASLGKEIGNIICKFV